MGTPTNYPSNYSCCEVVNMGTPILPSLRQALWPRGLDKYSVCYRFTVQTNRSVVTEICDPNKSRPITTPSQCETWLKVKYLNFEKTLQLTSA